MSANERMPGSVNDEVEFLEQPQRGAGGTGRFASMRKNILREENAGQALGAPCHLGLKDQKSRLDSARDTLKKVTVSSAVDSGKKKLRIAHDNGSGLGSSAVSTSGNDRDAIHPGLMRADHLRMEVEEVRVLRERDKQRFELMLAEAERTKGKLLRQVKFLSEEEEATRADFKKKQEDFLAETARLHEALINERKALAEAIENKGRVIELEGLAFESSSDTSIEIRGMEMDSSHQAIDVEEEHNSTKAAHQEAKEAAIRDMPAPVGYRRVKLPAKSATRSIVYDHGVRFEQDVDDPDPKKQLWFCACSPSCRAASANNQGGISCQITQTGNITRHLKNHGIESDKTRKTSATKATHATTVSKAKQTVKDSGDPGRLMMLLFVRVFIIAHLLAFSLSDSKHVRAFLDVCGDDLFPQTKMYPTMIKHFVVELYKATISRFSHALLSAVTGAGGPLLHANFDLWTSKTSNEKYVGLRLFWCTANFAIESALVAVKLFNPSADLSDSLQLSGALLLWVEDVLNELGLSPRCLFSTVTDAESDVKRLCLKVPKSEWEWCFPHMLNCALVEAFGTTASRVACKNLQAREIMDAVKKVAEHLNKSNLMKVMYEDIQHLMFGKATKLLNAVPHRWISICKVLEEVLRNWAALEEHYVKKERGAAFPLATYKTEIEELYSLMKPIAVLMQESQQTGVPTGLNTFLALVMLRCSTLDASKPLLITVPCKALAEEAGTTITTTVDRPAENLKPVTGNTRQMLLVAVNKRFFDKRYNRAVVSDPPPGYVFEMAACMSPCFVQLMWLSAVCSSQKEAQCVGKLIKDKVVDLMVSMAQGMGEEPVKEPEGDGGKSTAPREKRKLGPFAAVASPNKKSNEATKRLLASGVFGGSSSSKTDKKWPAVLTMREVCQHEFDRFQQRFEGACVDDYPVGDLLEFWTKEGRSLYPNMARAARVLLSVPASSAVLERDFSTAGRLITESRSKLDAAYAEMVLFLNGNQEYIPQEVPALSTEQALQAVLKRLSEPRPEIERLSSADAEQDNDFDEYAVEMSD